MNRQTILLLFGGESSEHDVSIMSARNVYAAIDKEKYTILLTYIDRNGKWWLLEMWQEDLDDHGGVQVAPVPGTGSLLTTSGDKVLHVDVAFPVMHGENGHEDGAIQGMLKMAHIPVVGCDIGASVVCWDKLYTKQILERNHIKTTPYVYYRGGQIPDYDRIVGEGGDLFVKPATAGSSIGVSKVRSKAEFEPAINLALKNSDRVVIEKAIKGREFEVAVLAVADKPYRVSGVGEIIPGEDFYNYNDKYSENSRAQVITNADISHELREELRKTARLAFYMLGCKGLARIDFLVSNSGEVYVNEVNTMPGFTDISMYPKLLRQDGIRYEQLIDELILDALAVKELS